MEERKDKKGLGQKINLEKRSKVLEYSLVVEDAVNSLLLIHLGILEKKSTKLFSNKVGISFKNKIDLLFDINIFSKNEHSTLELLMNLRNKFLHDIHCNSFLSTLGELDNGIKNRFKKYLNKGEIIENEKACSDACLNLYGEIIKIIHNKTREKRIDIQNKSKLINILFDKHIRLITLSINFPVELMKELESAELENPKVAILAKTISKKCGLYAKKITEDKKMLKLDKKFKKLFSKDTIGSILK